MSAPRKIVAYCDLLGFADLVLEQQNVARELLSSFYNFAQQTKVENAYEELELFLFSDFLFVQGDRVEIVVNYMCRLYRKALSYSEVSTAPMLIRGGIARGGVLTQNRREAPQVNKNYVVSAALTHAAKMESLVKGQRLLLSANEREEFEHYWNPQIEAICYDQPSIKPTKLFEKYRYQDLLWARDLALEGPTARNETMRLIKIADGLYREKFNEKLSVRTHYSETLRICLLSYASLLEPGAEAQKFVNDFVKSTLIPYPEASVWLGFLECVLLSKDGFAFHDEPALAKFMRFAVLSPIWGDVSNSLRQRENSRLELALQEFVKVVIPTQEN